MPVQPSSLTLNYDAILSSTLFNYRNTIADNISTANAFLYFLMKREKEAWETVADLGERAEFPLMYALAPADSYSGYDVLDTTPIDGITAAFYTWRQMAAPISISGLEEKKNTGEFQKFNLLKQKTEQAILGIQDLFSKALMRGNSPNGGSLITTAYTSTSNGSSFIDPLGLQVGDPATGTVGNISGTTFTWWQNVVKQSSASTFAGFLKEAANCFNQCSKGPGGPPNLHLLEQQTFELYEAALRAQFRAVEYDRIDIPFGNLLFRGQPVTWDQFVPDVYNGTVAITNGTWWMLNTKFWKVKYHDQTNFSSTAFIKPINQDAKVAHILWLGAMGCNNRRKQGVFDKITLTIAS